MRQGSRISVLMYHALGDVISPITMKTRDFMRQMDWLAESQIPVITLEELVEGLHRRCLPDNAAVLTFDDGFLSIYEKAMPVLLSYRFPATVFLVASYCGCSNDWPSQPKDTLRLPLLDWRQAREMLTYGFTFGSHSVTHARLDCLSDRELQREVCDSRKIIEDKLGVPVKFFAYPYGVYNQTIVDTVQKNYEGACTTNIDYCSHETSPWLINRIEAGYLANKLVFTKTIRGQARVYLQLRGAARTVANLLFKRPWI